MSKKKKNYLIDTSIILGDITNLVLLSDSNTNSLFIPDIVLDEVDLHKKGLGSESYQARKFNNLVHTAKVLKKWVENDLSYIKIETFIEETKVNLTLVIDNSIKDYSSYLLTDFKNILNDKRILDVANSMTMKVTLVTNDSGLKFRSISKDIEAETLRRHKDNQKIQLIHEFTISSKTVIPELTVESLNTSLSNFSNVLFTCEDTGEKVLSFYKNKIFNILDEKKLRSYPVKPRNLEQLFFLNMLLDSDVEIVVCAGVTGSGKNLLSLQGGLVNGFPIAYCRNTITAGDKESKLGFLKGDENTKLGVFSYPLTDSVHGYLSMNEKNTVITDKVIEEFMEEYSIEVININQMRGANLYNYIIFDEWQNSTLDVNKLMLTRMNQGSKVIIIGDLNQVDHPYLSTYDNALAVMLKHAQDNDKVAGVTMTKVLRGSIAAFAEEFL